MVALIFHSPKFHIAISVKRRRMERPYGRKAVTFGRVASQHTHTY